MPRIAMHGRKGFTLLELITVMIILSVLTVVLVTRAMDDSAQTAAELEAVKGHLRYAQSRAMADSTNWYVQFTATSYAMYEAGAGTRALPGAQGLTVPLEYHTATAGTVVLFDSLGRPFTDTSGSTPQSGQRIVLASAGAGNLTVMPETGYIP